MRRGERVAGVIDLLAAMAANEADAVNQGCETAPASRRNAMHQTGAHPKTCDATVTSAEPVRVIAIVDGEVIGAPQYVDGLSSANAWLDHSYPDAAQAAFYKAVKIAEHPDLICGGVYGSLGELAFFTRKVEQ